MRIFPIHACNYDCKYCTVYHQYNTPLKWKEFAMLPAQAWVKSINKIKWADWIIIGGGEPGLYPGIVELCNDLNHDQIVLYSNCSGKAVEQLEKIKKKIYIYASFHIKEELRLWKGKVNKFQSDGVEVFKDWINRINRLGKAGHSVSQPHVPNDGTFEIQFLPGWLLRTCLEGDSKQIGRYYSPHAHEERVKGKLNRKVLCSTKQAVVAQDGTIFNCQAGLWSKRKDLIIGNIIDYDWNDLHKWISCKWYGNCHPCSQGKKVKL